MINVGLDIGGTKIETRIFDESWSEIGRHRVETPKSYDAILGAIARELNDAENNYGAPHAIGIGTAGHVDAKAGTVTAANLELNGQPLVKDLAETHNRHVTLMNDASALALSEAHLGAARHAMSSLVIILGTGLGARMAVKSDSDAFPIVSGGEFGHTPIPAQVLAPLELPLLDCTCGRVGCYETYVSGSGLERLATQMLKHKVSATEIASGRAEQLAPVWAAFCTLTASFICTLQTMLETEVIVLAGGLSKTIGIEKDLNAATQSSDIRPFRTAPIVLAEGGDASGARGAALCAWHAKNGQNPL